MNDAVSSALEHLRLEGALFFRPELTEPFEFESSPLALADALVPGADRLPLLFGWRWPSVQDAVTRLADLEERHREERDSAPAHARVSRTVAAPFEATPRPMYRSMVIDGRA